MHTYSLVLKKKKNVVTHLSHHFFFNWHLKTKQKKRNPAHLLVSFHYLH